LAIAARDDGVGGADPQVGSGLIGMRDLAEALGGTMEVIRPPDAGTEVLITLPGELVGGVRHMSRDGQVSASDHDRVGRRPCEGR
jgi:signal transduction histidine kinase